MRQYIAKTISGSEISQERLNTLIIKAQQEPAGEATGKNQGRGSVIVDRQSPALIAKTYRRGGLLAHLVSKTYFSLSNRQTRMFRELALLEKMTALNLPTAVPVAAVVNRMGPFYQGHLITRFIEDSSTFLDIVNNQLTAEYHWISAGQTIRKFHDHGIFHADLNASNILFDSKGNCYLIDFDKGSFRKGSSWKEENLSRLRRSLQKHLINGVSLKESDWGLLFEAYQKLA